MDKHKKIEQIEECFTRSIQVKQKFLQRDNLERLAEMSERIGECLRSGGKVMFCGNGGSAADAQHLVAEMLVRLKSANDRQPLAAIALAQDTSTITACANDYSFEVLYARLVKALGRKGDILFGISTSGNSENVRRAFLEAKRLGIHTMAFLGNDGGSILPHCARAIVVDSNDTARIQETHITAGHALIESVENQFI